MLLGGDRFTTLFDFQMGVFFDITSVQITLVVKNTSSKFRLGLNFAVELCNVHM